MSYAPRSMPSSATARCSRAEAQDHGQHSFVPKIQDAGKHLLALINDILDLPKIEAGKMELYFENVDIATIVQEEHVHAAHREERQRARASL